MRITDKENKELAEMMLPRVSPSKEREREEKWRDEGTYLIVFFGMLSYRIIFETSSKKTAESELKWWQEKAKRGMLTVPSYTRNASPHDFDIRTQADLDALTKAIHDSYRFEETLRS